MAITWRRCSVGVVAAVAVLAACGSDGPDGDTSPVPAVTAGSETSVEEPLVDTTAPLAGTVEVKALDNTFIEETVEVSVGTEVVWRNGGRNDHDIVPVMDDQSWGIALEDFTPGDTYAHVFAEPGEYRYYCTVHGTADVGMTGTVIVT